LISTVVMFQAQNKETINNTRKVAVSFKVMTTSVTRPCFTTRGRARPRPIFVRSETGLVLRQTVSDHITDMHPPPASGDLNSQPELSA